MKHSPKKNKYCIVIPCFNEELRLPLGDYLNFINSFSEYELLFVDDGSDDATYNILKEFSILNQNNTAIIRLEINSGKAEAVRLGMLNAYNRKLYISIGYLDADLSIPFEEYIKLNEILVENQLIMSFGSRVKRIGSSIKKTMTRHLISRMFATVASTMLKIPVYDTQCGIKIFDASITPILFNEKFKSRWIFDIEIFYRILKVIDKKNVHKKMREIPLDICNHVDGSKIKLHHYMRIPLEMLRLHLLYR